MKKSILKSGHTKVTEVIDSETGEVMDTNIKHHTYIANSKEEFLHLYIYSLPVFRDISHPAKSVYAYLLEYCPFKTTFEIGGGTRSKMSKELHFSPSSIANALKELVDARFLYSISRGMYQINPRYAFKGSSSDRNDALKAIIELGCKDC